MNWKNRTIWTGDNLPILRGMNSDSVDLIYLDPPFNSKHDYSAPIGSKAAGAAFKDTWSLDEIDIAWLDLIEAKYPRVHQVVNAAFVKSDIAYLVYMAPRLLELYRLLKPNGSIYLHCDPTMSHYLKLLMDAVFGRSNFQNEIIWCYREAINSRKRWNRKHDVILFYSKTAQWQFNPDVVLEKHAEATVRKYKYQDKKGKYRLMGRGISGSPIRSKRDVSPDWETKRPDLVYRQYLREGTYPVDYWNIDIINQNAQERIGYPTQKPLALLERVIKASSNPDDTVLDPFCGCATTCVAAEILRRSWVGIDISPKAAELVDKRLSDKIGQVFTAVHRADVPERTDLGKVSKYNSRENISALYGEQGGNCNGCGEHFPKRNFEVDHITPQSQGGTDHLQNLQLLCGACNRVKGARGMDYLLAKLKR